MKKVVVLFGFAALAALGVSGAATDEMGRSPEEIARQRERMERKAKRVAENGGYVTLAPTGRVIRIVSAQTLAGQAVLKESIEVFSTTLRLPVEWGDSPAVGRSASELAAAANADGRCGAAILLVNEPNSPALLVAPEDFWVAINVAKLASDQPPRERFERRLKQEFWRAVCMVLGAYASQEQPCLLTLISGNSDLDRNVCLIPSIEVLPKTKSGAKQRGIVPGRTAVYRRACMEGWAPMPTNALQRAIWEQVKADKERGPTNPITIPPPNQKK